MPIWIVSTKNNQRKTRCIIHVCPNKLAAVRALTDYLRNYDGVDVKTLERRKLSNGGDKYSWKNREFYINQISKEKLL